ncbi:replication-relaxation family protein, partial [Ralstonia pseudosolanacearum]|nr:replication-relaxation family protein [Ralstonia pseudosolanacearum]
LLESTVANGKQATAKRMKMADRAQQLLDVHFPNTPDAWLWHRKRNDGFITIPRTLPIVMQAVDAASKGQPAGHTLFCLWARSPDNSVVSIENSATFAAEAGFMGERAVDTWRRRMKKLRDLHLIATKPGASGEFHYVLLMNPNASMEWMRHNGLVQDGIYSRFLERVADVGAFGDIEAIREVRDRELAVQAATTPPPPPPPATSTNSPGHGAPTILGTNL